MAKGARASTKKANNARLKSKVFGPVEAARLERLAAKTDALRAQPKPAPPGELTMDIEEVTIEEKVEPAALDAQTDEMEVEKDTTQATKASSNRIEKKRSSSRNKSSIVFPKYKNKKAGGAKPKKTKLKGGWQV